LTRYELALAAKSSYEAIAGSETGRRSFIGVTVLEFLRENCGVDTNALQREFDEWRSSVAEDLRAAARARSSSPQAAAGCKVQPLRHDAFRAEGE
jgi:hypothetical protein